MMSKFQEKYEDYLRHANVGAKDELAHLDRSSNKYKKASAYVKNADAYKSKLERVLGTKINNDSSRGSAINSVLLNHLVGFGVLGNATNAVTRRLRANTQRNMSDKALKEYLGKKKKK